MKWILILIALNSAGDSEYMVFKEAIESEADCHLAANKLQTKHNFKASVYRCEIDIGQYK